MIADGDTLLFVSHVATSCSSDVVEFHHVLVPVGSFVSFVCRVRLTVVVVWTHCVTGICTCCGGL